MTTVPTRDGSSGTNASTTKRPRGARRSATAREASLLALPSLEVEQRVVGDESGVERSCREFVDHVAHDRAHAAVGIARVQPGEHLRARVDADDVEVAGGNRDGETAGADAELEHSWSLFAGKGAARATTTSALTSASEMPVYQSS